MRLEYFKIQFFNKVLLFIAIVFYIIIIYKKNIMSIHVNWYPIIFFNRKLIGIKAVNFEPTGTAFLTNVILLL